MDPEEATENCSQGLYSLKFLKFHDFIWPFPWTFKIFHDLS